MIADFQRILPFTWKWECGIDPRNPRGNVDDRADRGGRTSAGVTQKTYDGACAAYGWPLGDVFDAPDWQLEKIYEVRFWKRVSGDVVPWPLCAALFDTGVLHGTGFAVNRLQMVLLVPVDGWLGPRTLEAIALRGPVTTTWSFLQQRDDRYEVIVAHDASQRKFYRGWEARLDALEDFLGIPRTLDRPPVPTP